MRQPPRHSRFAIAVLIVAFGGAPALMGDLAAHGASSSSPVLGRSEIVQRIAGRVSVRLKGAGRFKLLRGALAVPDGSEIDALAGRVQITVATPEPGQSAAAVAYQGRFAIHQDAQAPAETHFTLSGSLPACARAATATARLAAHASHRRGTRRLWVSEHGGKWGTHGHYVTTTVEGTRWLTVDECTSSRVAVAEGKVRVNDLIRHTSVVLTAGHSYRAIKPFVESRALVPAPGRVYMGVTGPTVASFQRQVGKHPAVLGFFTSWDHSMQYTFAEARRSRARIFLHISTALGYGMPEDISPAGIARGAGDEYLLELGRQLALHGQPAYVALMPEMNQTNNAYSAFNANGSSRGASHSTANFRQAWRRSVLILRGGSVAGVNRRLHQLRMPALVTSLSTLPQPRVAFLWAPQTAGSPDTQANAPAAYYPGAKYVDIVGTDFYSAFPNFTGLERLYRAYPTKPFGFNEWAMWRSGDTGFVKRFFAFLRSHRRVAIALYNQGLYADGPFRLTRFPAAAHEIRRQLASSRFPSHVPEWERAK